MVSDNVPTSRHHGAPKHGDALLAGLVRCRRCGRKLTVRYTGTKHNIPRYSCWRGLLDNGEPRCIAFGGLRVDDAIEEALLRVVEPERLLRPSRPKRRRPVAATRSATRSCAISRLPATPPIGLSGNMTPPIPQNRLVAAELEARWNRALTRVGEIESRIAAHDAATPSHHLCRQRTSRRWPRIFKASGRRRRRMPGSRSASCAPSSRRWSPISMMKRPRSSC